jgi:hypothetical protein
MWLTGSVLAEVKDPTSAISVGHLSIRSRITGHTCPDPPTLFKLGVTYMLIATRPYG